MQTSPRYGAAYLRSDWWRELRAAYESHPLSPRCCAVCATPRYQLHHRSYERVGNERVDDLIALCSVHHEALHRAWRYHRGLYPDAALAGFTDTWVLIQRRRYPNAPLPSLELYGLERSTRRGATNARSPDRRGRRSTRAAALR